MDNEVRLGNNFLALCKVQRVAQSWAQLRQMVGSLIASLWCDTHAEVKVQAAIFFSPSEPSRIVRQVDANCQFRRPSSLVLFHLLAD